MDLLADLIPSPISYVRQGLLSPESVLLTREVID